jgi:1,4-alpha-glucan branching enzyme
VISFVRRGRNDEGTIVCVCNFTPVVRPNYRIGVPEPGHYAERLNTDAEAYGGSNAGNEGGIDALSEPMHGRPYSLSLKLPPFSTVILQHRGAK